MVKDSSEICQYEVSVPIEIDPLVIINEINYRSSDEFNPDDWIELYNPKSTAIDVSNWEIRDEDDSHSYTIPEETQIQGNGFLVIVKDQSDFVTFFPNIPHIGELGYGLGRNDAVRLFNSENKLIDVVDYEIEDTSQTCIHTLNMFDSFGDGWQGNAVDVIIAGQTVIFGATFNSGSSASVTFEASSGDSIEMSWTDGSWSSEVSWEILDGEGSLIVSGEYGDTLVNEGIYANCLYNNSEWPTCADETGYTLELITPNLNNALAQNWDCINENGSPNAVNSESLYIEDVTTDLIKIYPNPVKNILYISGNFDAYDIEVYSILGQCLKIDSNTNSIDMSAIQEGVYLIKISNDNVTITKRIIKN